MGVLAAGGGCLQAAAVIYEPFSQSAGSLGGQAGGTGLSGNWSISQTVTVVDTPTLSYGDLPSTGGQVNLPTNSGVDAWIATTSVLLDNNLLADGATLWFSMMFMKTSGGGSNEWAGFAFGTERLDATYQGVLMTNSGNGVGFATRNASVNVATWLGGGNAAQGGSLSVPYSASTFIVGKIEWGAAAGDAETITLYTPSLTDLATLGTGVSKTVAGFDQAALDTISFTQRNSGGTYTFDEIRFGATYDDVLGEKPLLKLRVDPVTGETTILGNAGRSVAISYYEITSAGESLDAAGWVSLADQDFDGGGPPSGSGDGWEEAGGSGNDALAEAFLLGASTIGASQSVGLGKGYNADVNARDLVFTYCTGTGAIYEGLVEYATSALPGDANLDGVVDAADYIALKKNLGKAAGAKFREGDFDLDGDVDWSDLEILRAALAGGGSAAQVPEPASALLLTFAAAGLTLRTRGKSNWRSSHIAKKRSANAGLERNA